MTVHVFFLLPTCVHRPWYPLRLLSAPSRRITIKQHIGSLAYRRRCDANAAKSVDVEGDVREKFETAIKAGNIGKAPWSAATAWILASVNNDLIVKFNNDAVKALN